MQRFFTGAVLATALGIAATAVVAQPAQPPHSGRWITESGNLEVEIAPCGSALCGTVVRVLANRSMREPGKPMDAADPQQALGLTILSDLQPAEDGVLSGQIYNRENNTLYGVQLRLDGPQQLLVRPYIGLPLFGKTQLWRRVAGSPQAR